MPCPKCGFPASPEDTFCSKCGARILLFSPTHPTLASPAKPFSKLKIEFGHSSAASFPQALSLAKTFQTFAEASEGKTKTYSAEFTFEQMEDAVRLAELLKGWRNRWVYVDGERKQWSEVFNFSHCFDALKRAYRAEFHCFQGEYQNDVYPFGCALSNLGLVSPATGWLQAGSFDHESVFLFDKERMRKILEENLYRVRFCPALDLDRATEVLRAFPEKADLRRDPRWAPDPVEKGSAPSAATLILTLQVSHGYYQKERAHGVRAASRQAAIAILAEVAKRLTTSKPGLPKLEP